MGRGRPIDRSEWPGQGPHRAFVELLDRVHRENGTKSLADVAAVMNLRARSRVSALLRGKALPADDGQAKDLIRALGGSAEDEDRGLRRYRRARSASSRAPGAAPPDPDRPGRAAGSGSDEAGSHRRRLNSGQPPLLAGSSMVDRPEGEALHLLRGRLPLVREIDPLRLGVKPAVAAEGDDVGAPPRYVTRDGDADLERAIAEGDLVLLHGPAAAGKSRSAFEVVRRARPDHRLFVPARPESLRKLAQVPGAADNIVIWLDDLEQYLGPFGLDEAVLQDLAPGGQRDVLIVATMRDEELASLERALLIRVVGSAVRQTWLKVAAGR